MCVLALSLSSWFLLLGVRIGGRVVTDALAGDLVVILVWITAWSLILK